MQDKDIEERLEAVENTLEELVERQKETSDLVQGYLDSLSETIRDAEEKIQKATEEAVKQLTEEPAYPTSLRDAIERIDETVEGIRDSVERLTRVDAGEDGRKENAGDGEEGQRDGS